ncbi:MAG: arylsulfatase A-like enzyme [Myxococcota bacterium]
MGNRPRHKLLPLCLLTFGLFAQGASAQKIHVIHIGDDGSRGGVEVYRTAGIDTVADPSERISTPSLDTMAAAGVRFDNFVVYGNCSPTRAAFFGYGEIRRAENLYGRVVGANGDSPIEVDPYSTGNLVRNYKALGFTTSYVGKLHLEGDFSPTDGDIETFIAAMGIDHSPAIIAANPSITYGMLGTHANASKCYGHNYWHGYDRDGTLTLYGDGAAGTSGYTNRVISDAVQARIAWIQANDPTGDHVIFAGWAAPHAPWDSAGPLGDLCDYDGDTLSDDNRDDRVPGTSLPINSAKDLVYREAAEYMDTEVGIINSMLHLGPGGSSDLAVFFFDNGAPGAGMSSECDDSEGIKGTPFPCGTQVPLIVVGDVIQNIGVVDELMHITDLPKTLIDLAGGNYTGQLDGRSFADCIDGTMTPAACNIERNVVCYEEWDPLGGTTNNSIMRVPKLGDLPGEWNRHERACVTRSCHPTKQYLLRRVYDVDHASDITEFCEQFYVMDTSDDYLPLLEGARAETTGSYVTLPNACTSGINGGALQAIDFVSPAIDPAEECALNLLSNELDHMSDLDGAHPPPTQLPGLAPVIRIALAALLIGLGFRAQKRT